MFSSRLAIAAFAKIQKRKINTPRAPRAARAAVTDLAWVFKRAREHLVAITVDKRDN